jgi:hypothetical protein
LQHSVFLYSWHWHAAHQHYRKHYCVSTATMVTLTYQMPTRLYHVPCPSNTPCSISINCRHPIQLLSCWLAVAHPLSYPRDIFSENYNGITVAWRWPTYGFLRCLYRALGHNCYNIQPTCCNLTSQSIFWMFRALIVCHQEVSCNNRGIMLWFMSMYMVCDKSSVCGYTGIAIQVIAGHTKVHLKK